MADPKIITKKEKAGNRHWKNFVDKEYLGSHNLEKGEEMLVTIAKFEGEEEVATADGKKSKQVLYFKEDVPKLIINITNGNTLSALYGSHPDGWVGKQIQLFVAGGIKGFGKSNLEAIRIRDFIPKRDINVATYEAKLKPATTQAELKAIWVTFPASVRNDAAMIAAKDIIKNNLPA